METPRRIAILEDELLVADHLSTLLTTGGYEVVGSFDSAPELLDFLKCSPADIVLLDIKIKGEMDGIEAAHIIREEYGLPLAYLTSNTDMATAERVKMTEPITYIAKPYTAEGVLSALEIAYHTHLKEESVNEAKTTVASSSDEYIYVRSKKELLRVAFADITHVQAMDNYCIIHRRDQERLVVPRTLKHMEEELGPHGFIRTHRSYLANLASIERIGSSEVHIGEVEIPLSESHRQGLINSLKVL